VLLLLLFVTTQIYNIIIVHTHNLYIIIYIKTNYVRKLYGLTCTFVYMYTHIHTYTHTHTHTHTHIRSIQRARCKLQHLYRPVGLWSKLINLFRPCVLISVLDNHKYRCTIRNMSDNKHTHANCIYTRVCVLNIHVLFLIYVSRSVTSHYQRRSTEHYNDHRIIDAAKVQHDILQ
jgi:hypothetical protein